MKPVRVALVTSNAVPVSPQAGKGTEIWVESLVRGLVLQEPGCRVTVFASGDSQLPVPIETVGPVASTLIPDVAKNNKQIIFELALLAKAFSMADRFDVYHINIGDGDIALPLAGFVPKPVIVTLHHTLEAAYLKQYYGLFRDLSHVGFVAVSRYQQELIPDLNYRAMIYHGVDTGVFKLDEIGGEAMMWAGRLIPVKGPDVAMVVAQRLRRELKLFGLEKPEFKQWWEGIKPKIGQLHLNLERDKLVAEYRKSKLLLFPVSYEEAFGLVLIEAMACGTPVVAWKRGAIPEIVENGVTGWAVDPSQGVAGLMAAAERIYQLSASEYRSMRQNCRKRVEKYFDLKRMVADYAQLYQRIATWKD